MCDKLFDIDEHLNIVPQLATSYEWTDPKTLTIHLRPGVLFQDGEKMGCCRIAKSTLERNLILKGSYRRAEISAIDHIEIVDRLTVRLVLNSPDAPLVAQLADRAGMIVAPQTAAAEGANFDLASSLCRSLRVQGTRAAGSYHADPFSRLLGCERHPFRHSHLSRYVKQLSRSSPICRLERWIWWTSSPRPTSQRFAATRS